MSRALTGTKYAVRCGVGALTVVAAAAALILVWASAPSAHQRASAAGPPPLLPVDFLATHLEPTLPEINSVQFGAPDVPPIPADFFNPGSDPFFGLVPVHGIPLEPGVTGNASTVVERLADPVQPFDPPGTQGFVPIQLVELELRSLDPIVVTFNGGQDPEEWDLDITLSQFPTPPGNLVATKSHFNGGTFDAELFVQPVFVFTKVDDPNQVRVIDTGEFKIPPLRLQFGGANFVHQPDPALELILSGVSQWTPGVLEILPGDIFSQVLSPFTGISLGGGVAHTVVPATPKEGRCEVVTNNIPNGQTACTVTDNGDGTKNINVTFNMNATFRDNASCCEYRQEIKGEFKINGKKVNLLLGPGQTLDKDTFQQDCLRSPPAGTNVYYGHRSEPANTVPTTGDSYSNPNNRATGADYSGVDVPGMRNVKTGRTYSFNLDFRGKIIDTCNGTDARTATWNVTCSGTAAGGPDPLSELLIPTTIDGKDAILGVYLYPPGDVLTVVASIHNGIGLVPIDASEVIIDVPGLLLTDSPDPGPLFETLLRAATSQALYDFDYPPGSPQTVTINFTLGAETQSFDVDLPIICPADFNGDLEVNIIDLLDLLAAWGTPDGDITGDGTTDILDLLALLAAWGPC